jgi:hypothetical protein
MIKKTELNKKAVSLRKKGVTYSAILEKVPVAKSTLALWFKEVELSTPQKQRITEKRLAAGRRGGLAKKNQRIQKTYNIIQKAEGEVGPISKRELWLTGTTLYWAEGSKEKDWRPGSRASFINMDKKMIQVFLKWLRFCKVKEDEIIFDLYIHENHKLRVEEMKKYWSKITGFPINKFVHVYFKKDKVNTKRKNITRERYYGILKIIVKQSSSFLRQITGWINGIYNGINIEK